MSEITEKIKEELLKRCEKSREKNGYDFWNEHIKYVVNNSLMLAEKYNADKEIVELGALLHDISMPSGIGSKEEHHIEGAKIAEELLSQLNYPKDKIEHVKKCVLNHRGSVTNIKDTIEEQCVADADVIAHFDCIPSLFEFAYKEKRMSTQEGAESVKNKLERDFNKLSPMSKEVLKNRYENIIKVLFV